MMFTPILTVFSSYIAPGITKLVNMGLPFKSELSLMHSIIQLFIESDVCE